MNHRHYLRNVVWLLACMLACAAAFALGRISLRCRHATPLAEPSGSMINPVETTQYESGFDAFVARWNAYVIGQDGFIRADPYDALLQAAVVDSPNTLVESNIRFVRPLPPRINPTLSENPKWVLFHWESPTGEFWVAYADGTWTKLKRENWLKLSKEWWPQMTQLRSAGCPNGSLNAVDNWVAAKRQDFIWDPGQRFYVVHASTQPAP